MVDSGAGISDTSSTTNVIPHFYHTSVRINATAEGVIGDPTLTKLDVRAIHFDGMHHNVLSVH